MNRSLSPEYAGRPRANYEQKININFHFNIIILDFELKIDCKEERMEARRPEKRLLQSYRPKSILAWTRAVVVEMGKRGQVQDIFWKKRQ